jgi:hypothetical protein
LTSVSPSHELPEYLHRLKHYFLADHSFVRVLDLTLSGRIHGAQAIYPLLSRSLSSPNCFG